MLFFNKNAKDGVSPFVALVWLVFGRRHWVLEAEEEEMELVVWEDESETCEILLKIESGEDEPEIPEESLDEEQCREPETVVDVLVKQKAFADLQDLDCPWDEQILQRDLHMRKHRKVWQEKERKQLLCSLVDQYLVKISEEKSEPPRVMED